MQRSFPSPKTNRGSCASLWPPILMATSFVSSMISGVTCRKRESTLQVPQKRGTMKRPTRSCRIRIARRYDHAVIHTVTHAQSPLLLTVFIDADQPHPPPNRAPRASVTPRLLPGQRTHKVDFAKHPQETKTHLSAVTIYFLEEANFVARERRCFMPGNPSFRWIYECCGTKPIAARLTSQ